VQKTLSEQNKDKAILIIDIDIDIELYFFQTIGDVRGVGMFVGIELVQVL
jgi:hypothetical protein